MKPRLWVSYDEYQRLTAEDWAHRDFGIDFTRGGDWRHYPHNYEKDFLEEAEAHGVAITTLIQGRP